MQLTESLPVRQRFYSVPECSTIFHLPLRTTYAAVAKGLIASVRFNKRILVPETEIERLLNADSGASHPNGGRP
jgi:hypothetical protein